ncbi:NUDIX domain-containing protein [Acidipila sp. EB88]|uniref:NUDIX domain-containing protein n=1 Tax=Acidipila sp. EB88 TaxID=2305226 RepID=UPI000F5D95AE|nr:NUDIX domain-containing protein [Acidipila sp. EB88]RRA50318.1 NUDIX domain-containing protein [Acidipila sp. EB88]
MSKRSKQSAGLLMFRKTGQGHEVFLVHPGGPYWAGRDHGAWTLPKGGSENGEEPLAAARREFQEETGFVAQGPYAELGWVQQKSGKVVLAWAFAGDCDPADLVSNTCELEWPPRSKRRIVIPEVDRGAWFPPEEAALYLREEQRPFLLRLAEQLGNGLLFNTNAERET